MAVLKPTSLLVVTFRTAVVERSLASVASMWTMLNASQVHV